MENRITSRLYPSRSRNCGKPFGWPQTGKESRLLCRMKVTHPRQAVWIRTRFCTIKRERLRLNFQGNGPGGGCSKWNPNQCRCKRSCQHHPDAFKGQRMDYLYRTTETVNIQDWYLPYRERRNLRKHTCSRISRIRHGDRSERRADLMKAFGCTRKVWTSVKMAA